MYTVDMVIILKKGIQLIISIAIIVPSSILDIESGFSIL